MFVCWPMYNRHGLSSSQELESRDLAALNQYFFWSIVTLQGVAVMVLVPALVGGALAEEKQRRGLEVLLTTALSSVEIVLGKLLARMCYLIVVLLLSVPVFCLLSVNGGIDVGLVALSYAVTFTTGFLIAALAIAVSTLSDRPSKAVVTTYFLASTWLILPFVPNPNNSLPGDWLFSSLIVRGLHIVLRWVCTINPLCAVQGMSWTVLSRDLVAGLAGTMAAQVGISMLLILGSVMLLRPLSRREGSPASRFKVVSFLMSRRSLLPRRGCGDRPILWKECHLARTTVLARLVIALAVAGIAVPAGLETWRLSLNAFRELGVNGYGTLGANVAHNELNTFLRETVVLLYLAMALAVAVRSAVSVTKEIEKETWISLIATPLGATTVVGGKILGAICSVRWLGWIYVAFVALGVATGAVHPLGGCLVVLEALVFLCISGLAGNQHFPVVPFVNAVAGPDDAGGSGAQWRLLDVLLLCERLRLRDPLSDHAVDSGTESGDFPGGGATPWFFWRQWLIGRRTEFNESGVLSSQRRPHCF